MSAKRAAAKEAPQGIEHAVLLARQGEYGNAARELLLAATPPIPEADVANICRILTEARSTPVDGRVSLAHRLYQACAHAKVNGWKGRDGDLHARTCENYFGLDGLFRSSESDSLFLTTWPLASNPALVQRSSHFNEEEMRNAALEQPAWTNFVKEDGNIAVTYTLTEHLKSQLALSGPTLDVCPFATETQQSRESGVFMEPAFYTQACCTFFSAMFCESEDVPTIIVVQGVPSASMLRQAAETWGYKPHDIEFPGLEFVRKTLRTGGLVLLTHKESSRHPILCVNVTSISRLKNHILGGKKDALRATELICSVARTLISSHPEPKEISLLREAVVCKDDPDIEPVLWYGDVPERAPMSAQTENVLEEFRTYSDDFTMVLTETDVHRVETATRANQSTRKRDKKQITRAAEVLANTAHSLVELGRILSTLPICTCPWDIVYAIEACTKVGQVSAEDLPAIMRIAFTNGPRPPFGDPHRTRWWTKVATAWSKEQMTDRPLKKVRRALVEEIGGEVVPPSRKQVTLLLGASYAATPRGVEKVVFITLSLHLRRFTVNNLTNEHNRARSNKPRIYFDGELLSSQSFAEAEHKVNPDFMQRHPHAELSPEDIAMLSSDITKLIDEDLSMKAFIDRLQHKFNLF